MSAEEQEQPSEEFLRFQQATRRILSLTPERAAGVRRKADEEAETQRMGETHENASPKR